MPKSLGDHLQHFLLQQQPNLRMQKTLENLALGKDARKSAQVFKKPSKPNIHKFLIDRKSLVKKKVSHVQTFSSFQPGTSGHLLQHLQPWHHQLHSGQNSSRGPFPWPRLSSLKPVFQNENTQTLFGMSSQIKIKENMSEKTIGSAACNQASHLVQLVASTLQQYQFHPDVARPFD